MLLAPTLQQIINDAKTFSAENSCDLNVVSVFCQLVQHQTYKNILMGFGISIDSMTSLPISGVRTLFPELLSGEKAEKEYSQILDAAEACRVEMKHDFVDIEHMMMAIVGGSTTVNAWMSFAEFPRDEFYKMCEKVLDFEAKPSKDEGDEDEDDDDDEPDFKLPPMMQKFLTDITADVMIHGKKIFGREKEIEKLANILVRRNKNNAILLGENGVGRKSICRGLAEKILSGDTSEFLSSRIVYELDVNKLVAGTGLMGSLEARMTQLFEEMEDESEGKHAAPPILVIPNLSSTVNSGGREGSADVSNLLKSFLESDRIPVVGICTQAEYKKTIEKSLSSYFETIKVAEPSLAETKKMVLASLERLQQYHVTNVELLAIDEILTLCQRYLPYKHFPEKAFNVLDELMAATKNKYYRRSPKLKQLEESIETQLSKLGGKMPTKNTPLWDKLNKMGEKLGNETGKWMKKISSTPPTLSAKDAISAFAERYEITENQLYQTQTDLLSDLADNIKKEVFGQDHAVDEVCDLLLCTKVGIRDKTKPLAKFLFVGSSGVGKTVLAKKVAKNYFGDEKCYTKIDMSEFQERGTSSGLIGTTAGYIGYESGGRLTEYVKHNPSCVVLFDEIEKSHPDVLNLLLQIMDDGCLTDGQGYKVDFTNTIIILTTNIGATSNKSSMGFVQTQDKVVENKDAYLLEVKKHLKPELLGRIDGTIVFNDIDEKTCKSIIQERLNHVVSCLKEQNVSLTIDNSVLDYIYNIAKGNHARKIQSIVTKELEVPVSKVIIKSRPNVLVAKIENNKLSIT